MIYHFGYWIIWENLPKQNGAPIRLVVPWKYGLNLYKINSKNIILENEPLNTWQKMASNEYGFLCKCKSNVDHQDGLKKESLGSF